MTNPDDSEPLEVDVILPLAKSEDETAWKKAAARKLKTHPKRIHDLRLRKRSLDARKREIKVQLRFEVGLDGPLPPERNIQISLPTVSEKSKTVVIVGSGPAGMFAALTALKKGWQPIVLERGKDASARRFDLAPILRHG